MTASFSSSISSGSPTSSRSSLQCAGDRPGKQRGSVSAATTARNKCGAQQQALDGRRVQNGGQAWAAAMAALLS